MSGKIITLGIGADTGLDAFVLSGLSAEAAAFFGNLTTGAPTIQLAYLTTVSEGGGAAAAGGGLWRPRPLPRFLRRFLRLIEELDGRGLTTLPPRIGLATLSSGDVAPATSRVKAEPVVRFVAADWLTKEQDQPLAHFAQVHRLHGKGLGLDYVIEPAHLRVLVQLLGRNLAGERHAFHAKSLEVSPHIQPASLAQPALLVGKAISVPAPTIDLASQVLADRGEVMVLKGDPGIVLLAGDPAFVLLTREPWSATLESEDAILPLELELDVVL